MKAIDDALLSLYEREEEIKKELTDLQSAIKVLENLGNLKKEEVVTIVKDIVKKEEKPKIVTQVGRTKKILDYVALHPGEWPADIALATKMEGETDLQGKTRGHALITGMVKNKKLAKKDGRVYLPIMVTDNTQQADPNYQPTLREKMILANLKSRGGKATIATVAQSLSEGKQPYLSDYREEMQKMVSKGILIKEGQFVRTM